MYLTTDLNPHATRCTLLTGETNSVPLSPVLTDLTASLLPRLEQQVDVLVFNPPYVETWSEEASEAQLGGTIERAWAGGEGGMEVTNRVLEQVEVRRLLCSLLPELFGTDDVALRVQPLLSERGMFYLVAVPQNKPLEILAQMKARGLAGEVCTPPPLHLLFFLAVRFRPLD